MSVSALLITHALSDEAVRWFSAARQAVDELVVFVDDARAAPDLADKLRQLDARVYGMRAGVFHQVDLAGILRECTGEWVLKLDYDEELSPEWHDPRWREILRSPEFTHYWLPRRWITTAGKYLHSEPWWPDPQLRLFRNQPDAITMPTLLHDHLGVAGPGGFLRSLAIHHHDLRLTSREQREAKAAAYERQRPGNGLGFFYLYEDYARPELPVPTMSNFDPATEIARMEKLSDEGAAALRIDAEPPPARCVLGQLLWLKVRVSNRGPTPICFGGPWPMTLAYHWFDAQRTAAVVWDGARTALLQEIGEGDSIEMEMFVRTPEMPGAYILQICLLQEQVRWLDVAGSPTTREFAVTVEASG